MSSNTHTVYNFFACRLVVIKKGSCKKMFSPAMMVSNPDDYLAKAHSVLDTFWAE